MVFTEFLHHLLKPHCPECLAERLEQEARDIHCDSCDFLKMQLAKVEAERDKLLEAILTERKPIVQVEQEEREAPQPITKNVPWSVRQQMLEKEDRAKALELARESAVAIDKSTEELEKELLGRIRNVGN